MVKESLSERGVEFIGEGDRKALFFEGQVVAMFDKGVLGILPTQSPKVSEIFHILLKGSGYSHYLKDGKNWIVYPDSSRGELGKEGFSLRLNKGVKL